VKVISVLLDFAFFQVEVIFVDFGNTETVNPSEMVLLDARKKTVAEFPHQVSFYTELPENTVMYHIYTNMRQELLVTNMRDDLLYRPLRCASITCHIHRPANVCENCFHVMNVL
jgi:hypothetical protein